MPKTMLQPVDPELQIPAESVATELEETSKGVRRKINRAIQVAGMAKIVETVIRAQAVQGQLLIKDGSRPRTLGGCFFHLLKEDLGEKFNLIQRPLPPKRAHEELSVNT